MRSYCTVLYCTVLHCTALHCTVFYSTKKRVSLSNDTFSNFVLQLLLSIFFGILRELDYQIGDLLSANVCVENSIKFFSSTVEVFSIMP